MAGSSQREIFEGTFVAPSPPPSPSPREDTWSGRAKAVVAAFYHVKTNTHTHTHMYTLSLSLFLPLACTVHTSARTHLHSVCLEVLLPRVAHEVADVDEVVHPALDVGDRRLVRRESPLVINDELERVLPLLLPRRARHQPPKKAGTHAEKREETNKGGRGRGGRGGERLVRGTVVRACVRPCVTRCGDAIRSHSSCVEGTGMDSTLVVHEERDLFFRPRAAQPAPTGKGNSSRMLWY